jgi:hypothetical protein
VIGAVSRIARSNAAAYCIALLCIGLLIAQATALFPRQFGVDFYQFWGVPVAKKASGTPHSPYVDTQGYADTLNALSDASDSAKLRLVNRLRRNLEPMGTPFLYASFSLFPDDYGRAQALFAVIQHLATGLAVVLLARLRGVRMGLAICIAAAVEITFNPFVQDVKVGNVNSLQLLFMVVLLHVAVRRRYSGSALVDGLFVGSLALFVMFKPNTVWIAAALALHYGITAGHRKFWTGMAVAACLGGVALAAGAWYFGNARVWGEWLQFARALDGSGLPLSLQDGNVSLAMLLSQGSRAYGAVGFGAIIAVSMMIGLVIAMSDAGRRPDLVVRTALDAFSDPWFALSMGVLFTFATFPLVWPHYHLFALIPMFWLFRREGRWDAGTWGAVISYCGWSRPVLDLLAAGEYRETSLMLVVFSWIALLPGVFGYVAQRRRMLEAAPQRSPA